MQDYDDFDFDITIDRVKKALQRSTHLTNFELWQEYPEFMEIWNSEVWLEALRGIRTSVKDRAKQILVKNDSGLTLTVYYEKGYHEGLLMINEDDNSED